MAHVRRQIREAAAALLDGLTTTGSNVFQSRSRQLQESQVPGLRVYTRNEVSERAPMGSAPELLRKVELMVECIGRKIDDLDDNLDLIASEVEVALGASLLSGLIMEFPELVSTDSEIQDEGNQPIGVVTLRFTVQYMTTGNDPDNVSF